MSFYFCYCCFMVHLLIDNNYFPQLLFLIDNAKIKIYGIIYIVFMHSSRKSDPALQILNALIRAKNRGVDVRILINSILKRNMFSKHNLIFARALQAANITVSITDTNRTTHSKVWTFDNDYILIGSHNLTTASLTSNRELSTLITDNSATLELQNYIVSNIYTYKDKWLK